MERLLGDLKFPALSHIWEAGMFNWGLAVSEVGIGPRKGLGLKGSFDR